MEVWKIASRWSNTGTKESSILDIFRKYGIVFAGTQTEKIEKKVQQGDLIAISDGLKIVSVAKALSNPVAITNFTYFTEEDKQRFSYTKNTIAFRVEIFNLNEKEIFTTKMGTFHGMGKYSDKVIKLYNSKLSSSSNFEINTNTYNLFDNSKSQTNLIQMGLKYIIPVYQRPYSWNYSQIESLLNDIFISFWGTEKNASSESIFIGTMQLSDKRYSNEHCYYQEVIDGQQRITTLTLLLKVLQNKYPIHEILKSLTFDWLDTDVNRGKQSQDLKEVLFKNKLDNSLNKYVENYNIIKEYFESNISTDIMDEDAQFNENDFINHLLKNLYFVVIETKAGLSKTLQIFNAINTTGLDLDNTDIFKIRLYEYLSNDGDNQEIFESIDKLYEKIDNNNNTIGKKVTDMNGILHIYKSYLISKYSLNMTLWRMATGTFFEQLFDTLLNIKQWNGFKDLKNNPYLLKIEDINRIIEVRYEWENKHYGINGNFDDFNTMLSLRLLWWSRYSNYWTLPFLYLMHNDAENEKYNKLIQVLSRLYITYTLMYQKQIHEIHNFTKEIFKELVQNDKNIDEIIEKIKNKYIAQGSRIKDMIAGDIFWNPKIKNILTRMSASIDENKKGQSIKEIEDLIFAKTSIDIEHIKSRNDNDFKDNAEQEKWNNILNTIGNLMILEYDINRSIGNNSFSKKMEKYKDSKFCIVKNLSKQFPSWTLESAEKRKELEIKKITEFIYS